MCLKTNIGNSWYFDNDCLRHMTSVKDSQEDYQKIMEDKQPLVMEQNGVSLKNERCVASLPNLRNMLYVEGLKANLISINQLCDDNLFIKFNKDLCEVLMLVTHVF